MNKYCIGWIPHLNGAPFLTNRWWQRVYGKRDDGERVYFRFQKESIPYKKPFNVDRIAEYFGMDNPDEIRKKIKNSTYFAHCRPVDDLNIDERWFFVYIFADDTLTFLSEIYIFKKFAIGPHGSKNYVLRYLAKADVIDITGSGIITLNLPSLATGTLPGIGFDIFEQYLKETFQAIRDILHHHSHHINPFTHPHHIVPDSIICPIMSEHELLDKQIMMAIADSYQICLQEHLEHITELASSTVTKTIWMQRIYAELVSVIRQANGVLIYYNQFLLEIKKSGDIKNEEYSDLKESSINMKTAYQSFSDSLNNQFHFSNTVRSDLLLVVTALLTFWIVFIESLTYLSEGEFLAPIENLKPFLLIIPIIITFFFAGDHILFVIQKRWDVYSYAIQKKWWDKQNLNVKE